MGQSDCLLLGTLSAFLLPFAVVVVFCLLDAVSLGVPEFKFNFVTDLLQSGKLALYCAPFGLVTGWLHWQVGIRPIRASPDPAEKTANVFD
jgi:hypothetical protein